MTDKATSYKTRMVALSDHYNDAILDVADAVFNQLVKPWLQSNGYYFMAGNGSYFIHLGHDWVIDHDLNEYLTIPEEIKNALDSEIPLMPQNNFGSIMPDLRPEQA